MNDVKFFLKRALLVPVIYMILSLATMKRGLSSGTNKYESCATTDAIGDCILVLLYPGTGTLFAFLGFAVFATVLLSIRPYIHHKGDDFKI